MGLSTLIWKARDELLAIGCYTGKKRGKLNKYTTDSNNYISPFLTILPTTKATTSDTTVVPPSIPAKTEYRYKRGEYGCTDCGEPSIKKPGI